MSFEFKLPDLGEGMAEVEVISWYVAEGDDVTLDQPLLSVETDKLVTDLPSPVAGRVTELRATPGDKVPVGHTLVLIDALESSGAARGERRRSELLTAAATPRSAPPSIAVATAPKSASASRRPRVRAAPAVRKLALDLGVDLSELPGTGPEGRITRDDVLAAIVRRLPDGRRSPTIGACSGSCVTWQREQRDRSVGVQSAVSLRRPGPDVAYAAPDREQPGRVLDEDSPVRRLP